MFSRSFRSFARKLRTPLHATRSACAYPAKSVGAAVAAGVFMGATIATMEQKYEGGQAIGEGLKAEIWKAKHPQSNVLDMESEAVQLLLTHVRDAECTGPCFTSFANMLVRHLLTEAMAALPNDEEAEITTSSGHKFQGLKLEDDVKLLAIYLHPDGSDAAFLERAISDCFRDADVTGMTIRNGRIVKDDVSRDAGEEYSNALIVSPSMDNADAEIAVVNALAKKGFKEEDIVLATIVASLDGINKLNKDCKEVQVVAATVDPHVSPKGEVIPGIGDIFARYTAALTEPEGTSARDNEDAQDAAEPATPSPAAAVAAEPAPKQAAGSWGGWWSQGK